MDRTNQSNVSDAAVETPSCDDNLIVLFKNAVLPYSRPITRKRTHVTAHPSPGSALPFLTTKSCIIISVLSSIQSKASSTVSLGSPWTKRNQRQHSLIRFKRARCITH